MVKYYHSNMPGAPVLSGAAGALIAILDACLKDGFGLKTVDSLVIAGGVATMTISTGMTFEQDAVVQIAGITGGAAALNGDRRLLSIAGNTATFDATGVSDQAATGSITAKVSPLGWAKPFSGTNVGVYRATDPTSLGMYLRVDDTGTTVARVVGYETMSDVNTGTGPFPTSAQVAGGGYWEKSGAAGATARNWIVVGDERAFYWWCVPNAATTITSQGLLRGFGDLIPRRSTDAYAAFVQAGVASMVTSTSTDCDLITSSYTAASAWLTSPRTQSSLGSAAVMFAFAESRRATTAVSRSGVGVGYSAPFPNSADNALDLDRVLALDPDYSVRGTFPGLLHLPQAVSFSFQTWDRLDGQGLLSGRRLMAVRGGAPGYAAQNSASGAPGVAAFDITGPWR